MSEEKVNVPAKCGEKAEEREGFEPSTPGQEGAAPGQAEAQAPAKKGRKRKSSAPDHESVAQNGGSCRLDTRTPRPRREKQVRRGTVTPESEILDRAERALCVADVADDACPKHLIALADNLRAVAAGHTDDLDDGLRRTSALLLGCGLFWSGEREFFFESRRRRQEAEVRARVAEGRLHEAQLEIRHLQLQDEDRRTRSPGVSGDLVVRAKQACQAYQDGRESRVGPAMLRLESAVELAESEREDWAGQQLRQITGLAEALLRAYDQTRPNMSQASQQDLFGRIEDVRQWLSEGCTGGADDAV